MKTLVIISVSILCVSSFASAQNTSFTDLATKRCAQNEVKENVRLDGLRQPHISLLPLEFVALEKSKRVCMFTDVLEKKFTKKCVQKCTTKGGILIVLSDSKLFGKGCYNDKNYTVACRAEIVDTVNGLFPEVAGVRKSDGRYSDAGKKVDGDQPQVAEDLKKVQDQKVTSAKSGSASSAGVESKRIRARIDVANENLREVMNTQYTLFKAQLVDIKIAAEALGRETKLSRVLFAKSAEAFIETIKDKYITTDTAARKNTIILKQFPKTSKEYLKAQAERPQIQKQLAAYGGILRGYGEELPVSVSK